MNRRLKSFWGCISLALFLICILFVFFVYKVSNDRLRSIPIIILIGFGVCSTGIFLLWLNRKVLVLKKSERALIGRAHV